MQSSVVKRKFIFSILICHIATDGQDQDTRPQEHSWTASPDPALARASTGGGVCLAGGASAASFGRGTRLATGARGSQGGARG